MITALPFIMGNLNPEALEFDGLETFVFISNNKQKITVVSILNLWYPTSTQTSSDISLGFALPSNAEKVKLLLEKMYTVPGRVRYPLDMQLHDDRLVYGGIDLAEIPDRTNFWTGVSYEINAPKDFLNVSLFSLEQVQDVEQLISGIPFSFPSLRNANISVIHEKGSFLVAGTLSGSENEAAGKDLSRRFKFFKKELRSANKYSRLTWHLDYPSVNRPLDLHILLSDEITDKTVTNDLQTIVVNLRQQVKVIERQMYDIEYRVAEINAKCNELSK